MSSTGQRATLQRFKGRADWPSGCPSVLHQWCNCRQFLLPVCHRPCWLSSQQLVNTLTPGCLSQRGPILSDVLVTMSICRWILLLHSTLSFTSLPALPSFADLGCSLLSAQLPRASKLANLPVDPGSTFPTRASTASPRPLLPPTPL